MERLKEILKAHKSYIIQKNMRACHVCNSFTDTYASIDLDKHNYIIHICKDCLIDLLIMSYNRIPDSFYEN